MTVDRKDFEPFVDILSQWREKQLRIKSNCSDTRETRSVSSVRCRTLPYSLDLFSFRVSQFSPQFSFLKRITPAEIAYILLCVCIFPQTASNKQSIIWMEQHKLEDTIILWMPTHNYFRTDTIQGKKFGKKQSDS